MFVRCFLLYTFFFYDNFPYPGSRRYSEDETDRSAHSGSAEVVMKTDNCPFPKSGWATTTTATTATEEFSQTIQAPSSTHPGTSYPVRANPSLRSPKHVNCLTNVDFRHFQTSPYISDHISAYSHMSGPSGLYGPLWGPYGGLGARTKVFIY